jgi:hypothetical protein
MIRKSATRFFEEDHAQTTRRMIGKSATRFFEKDHAQTETLPDPKGSGLIQGTAV